MGIVAGRATLHVHRGCPSQPLSKLGTDAESSNHRGLDGDYALRLHGDLFDDQWAWIGATSQCAHRSVGIHVRRCDPSFCTRLHRDLSSRLSLGVFTLFCGAGYVHGFRDDLSDFGPHGDGLDGVDGRLLSLTLVIG